MSDNDKEVVLWRPLLNFSPRDDDEYSAARALPTTHGMIHVQRAGLQRDALHGIFHNPGHEEPRQSFRVAITARITHPHVTNVVQDFVKQGSYVAEFGPDGDIQLPRPTSTA